MARCLYFDYPLISLEQRSVICPGKIVQQIDTFLRLVGHSPSPDNIPEQFGQHLLSKLARFQATL